MTTDDPDKTEFARQLMKARRELVDKDYEIGKFRAVAWMAFSSLASFVLISAFNVVAGHSVREAQREVVFSGDCANIRTELGPGNRSAKVVVPPGCHYNGF